MASALQTRKSILKDRARRAKWPFIERRAQGGLQRLYQIDQLPSDIQAAIALHRRSLAPARTAEAPAITEQPAEAVLTYDRDVLWTRFQKLPAAARDEAHRKLGLLLAVMELIDNGARQRAAFAAVGQTASVPWRTIESWYQGTKKKPGVKHYARADWLAALVDDYAGATERRAEFTDAAWEAFKADYLRDEAPDLVATYHRLERAAAKHGWHVPSLPTVARRVKQDIPLTTRVLKREGEQALMQLYPYQERSVRKLYATEWINGDGYLHNVFVRWPDGSVERPRTWFWQDVYSRRILAWRVDRTENSDLIRLAFADVLDYGIPRHVTIDNTRGAANKWLSGGVRHRYRFKVREDDPLGIFPMFGCKVSWTSVHGGRGHGQAKPVERAFGVGGIGEYVDKHPAFRGAYTGKNPTTKPESYGTAEIPLEQFLRIMAGEIAAWNALPQRRTEMARGVRSFDQVFAASYAAAPITKATEEQKQLCLLCAEAILVQRDGTFTLKAGSITGAGRDGRNRYGAPELYDHVGQKIVVRFDPQELHERVFAETLRGRGIAAARCIEAAGFGDTEAGRAHSRARKQFIRAARQAAAAELRMTALQAAALLPDAVAAQIPESKVVRMFHPAQPAAPLHTELTEEEAAAYEAGKAEMARDAEVVAFDDDPLSTYRRFLRIEEKRVAGGELSATERNFIEWYRDSQECESMRATVEAFRNDAAR